MLTFVLLHACILQMWRMASLPADTRDLETLTSPLLLGHYVACLKACCLTAAVPHIVAVLQGAAASIVQSNLRILLHVLIRSFPAMPAIL